MSRAPLAVSSIRGKRAARALLVAAMLWVPGFAGSAAELSVRWLGVAGFTVSDGESVVALDPYFSRPGLWHTLVGDYEPDPAVLEPLLAAGGPAPELARAGFYLIGHSHFDHLGDAPWLAARSGGTLAGSRTSVAISRAYALPEAQTRRVDPGDRFAAGGFDVRVVESRHAKVFLGDVPLPGEVTEPPDGPIHAMSFKLGDARAYLLTQRATGLRILHLSSAGLHAPALAALAAEDVEIDLLLPAIMGRQPDYAKTLVASLRPRVVIPHHFDDFWEPLDSATAAAPIDEEDVAAFAAEVRAAAEALGLAAEVRRLELFESYRLEAAPATAPTSPRNASDPSAAPAPP